MDSLGNGKRIGLYSISTSDGRGHYIQQTHVLISRSFTHTHTRTPSSSLVSYESSSSLSLSAYLAKSQSHLLILHNPFQLVSTAVSGFPEVSSRSVCPASRIQPLVRRSPKCDMGLSPYPTPTDAGVLCVILVNTAISINIVKEIVRSILHVIGIRIASWEEYSVENPLHSFDCRESPSESYMEEFRTRTPAVRYDTLFSCCDRPKQECSVCLTEFKPDAEINYLTCGHVFHKLCLEKWLKRWNLTCPLCRNHMMPQDAEEDTCPM